MDPEEEAAALAMATGPAAERLQVRRNNNSNNNNDGSGPRPGYCPFSPHSARWAGSSLIPWTDGETEDQVGVC